MEGDCGPHPVQFRDGSVPGGPAIGSWLWDFGDGVTSAMQDPAHTYPSPGDYIVRLTVTDEAGESSMWESVVTATMNIPCISLLVGQLIVFGAQTPRDGSDGTLAAADTDGDGVVDGIDNCPQNANAPQGDVDGDGFGDLCDTDADQDRIPNVADNCPMVPNPNQTDMDGNGLGDACDAGAAAAAVQLVFQNCSGDVFDASGPAPLDGSCSVMPMTPSEPRMRPIDGSAAAPTRSEQTSPDLASPAGTAGVVAATTVVGVVLLSWRRLAARAGRSIWQWPLGLGGGAMGLFSRIADEDLLEHPGRQALINHIRDHPGIHFRALQRAVGAGSASVQYHINILLRAGLVHRHEWKGAVGYYAEGSAAVPAHDTLRSETARRVLGQIVTNPGLTAKEIATHLDCDPSLVAYHLRQFQAVGLIDRVTSSGLQRIMARPDAVAVLGTA